MTTKTVCISREEYDFLKHQANINAEVVEDFKMSLEDLKKGKFRIRT